MRNLVSRSPQSIRAIVGEEDHHQYFGLFTSPRNGQSIYRAVEMGIPWAADNDGFGFWSRGEPYNPKPLLKWLPRWQDYADSCLFVVAPDILTNACATLQTFWLWRDIIAAYGYPVAFAVQDGIEDYPPPWGYFDALFIGATNRTKYSRHVAELVRGAKARGLWVHNGRVNGLSAVRYSKTIGCDSFDGTGFTHEPSVKIPKVLPMQKEAPPMLFNLDDVG